MGARLGAAIVAASLGALGMLVLATAGSRSCSSPRRSLFVLFMGTQERYFGRWLLPVFPILCLLAA